MTPASRQARPRPWIRPAVGAAVDALATFLRQVPGWPEGLLHAAPAPEAFRYDSATGSCGIIDWSSAVHGPLLYDLASAVMYLGGPDRAAAMTDAYQAAGPLSKHEIAGGLPVMLRFRWAVQADYFARRVTSNDLTGITGPEENEKGIEDARR
jgi:Ser/Thr protein kinase RdoA (MazF antagonist)